MRRFIVSDKYEELEKLQSLKEREIISEEEFQKEKERILNAPEKKKINLKLSTLLFILFLLILVIAIVCVVITDNKNNVETDNEKTNQNVVENAIDDERKL